MGKHSLRKTLVYNEIVSTKITIVIINNEVICNEIRIFLINNMSINFTHNSLICYKRQDLRENIDKILFMIYL